MKVQAKHGKVTQNMHGTSINYRYVWDVLSCESHPKCKLKATDNFIKRTLRKVNNPCTRRYKHHYFIPGGNNTSPSLMFLSLKLDIRGLNPQSSITLSLGVANKILGQSKYCNEEHARIYSRTKYKREEPNILLITDRKSVV